MQILELYSGIGGMHLAFQESGVDGEIVGSVDINTVANSVYKHNFPSTNLYNRNIQSLTPEFINKLNVDTILMSPPCQPFTRNGLKQDIADARTNSFVHLLEILPELNIRNILIENVKGFECSVMHSKLIETLRALSFHYEEYMLSPSQFGIPNTRHRYYCLATKIKSDLLSGCDLLKTMNNKLYRICDILENNINLQQYLLPEKILQKRARIVDICYPSSVRSCCFTKAYGRYVEGTGSVLTYKTIEDVDAVYTELESYEPDSLEYMNCINKLSLRFFTPREVCRLMAFPDSFSFPSDLSNKQKYMLLGNSINIRVVAELIKILNK